MISFCHRTILLCLSLTATTVLAKKPDMTIKSIADFDICKTEYSYDTSVCIEPLRKFVVANPTLALEAAKKVRTSYMSWVALSFFEVALKNEKKQNVCADEDFQLSLMSGLQQAPKVPEYKMAQIMVTGQCKQNLIGAFEKELNNTNPETFVEVACGALKAAQKNHEKCSPAKKEAVAANAEADVLPNLEKANLKIKGDVKVYTGPENETLTMAEVEGQPNVYLVLLEGVKGDWNGKSMLHKEKVLNADRSEFWTMKAGKKWVTVAKTTAYGSTSLAVSTPGNPAMTFVYNSADTKKRKPASLIEKY